MSGGSPGEHDCPEPVERDDLWRCAIERLKAGDLRSREPALVGCPEHHRHELAVPGVPPDHRDSEVGGEPRLPALAPSKWPTSVSSIARSVRRSRSWPPPWPVATGFAPRRAAGDGRPDTGWSRKPDASSHRTRSRPPSWRALGRSLYPLLVGQVTTGDFGIGSWVARRARITPDHPALISGARSLTYAELGERIRRLANGLRSLGVGRGDRVAWLGSNHTAFLESLFAVGQLGAILAPVNHRLRPDGQAVILAQTEPIVLIQHDIAEPVTTTSVRHSVTVDGSLPGAVDYESLVAGSPDQPIDETVALADLVLLPHTSGTTGDPKAVMLTHGNVTWNSVNFMTTAVFRGDDVTIAIAPFFRVGGTGVNVLPVLFMGGTVVVPDDATPDGILRLMAQHRVTVGFGNPDLLDALAHADTWPSVDLSSIRFVLTGGAPVPERLIRAYLDRGMTLLQGYGLSEAAPLALLLDAEHALQKVGSAGKPPLFVDTRITDAAGNDVAIGHTGELLVRGPNVMAGYWKRPAETRESFIEGGWLRTGDAARMDDDGYVWIVDRLEARFFSAGKVVYPGDIERTLLTHPAVADAGVVGVTTATGEAAGIAFVVPSPGAAATGVELLAFCHGRLAAHQVPTAISFVDALPRNAAGKLLRDDLLGLVFGGPNEGDSLARQVPRRGADSR
jgi:fatty-acyl-CoA synthase